MICTLSSGPMPLSVIVALAPGAVKFSVTVPSGTLFSVNCPWPSVVVEMFVPAMDTVTLVDASVPKVPPSSARVAVIPAPLTVPEIEAPADDDEGPTGESEAFPPHAVTATISAARMIRFITTRPPGKPGEYWASRVPAELISQRAVFFGNPWDRTGCAESSLRGGV